jgi:hypothetical protein
MATIKPEKNTGSGDSKTSIGRSGITSPYFDLAAAIAVAQSIQQQGGGTASPEQLAHWLGYKSTKSGTYMIRISAASKHFGLINTGSNITLTERAKTILSPVMPEDALAAKVDAFLAVPLFSKVHEHFKGAQLPPEAGLKNLFLNSYKVLPDRVAQAVRVFLNSAEQAGFFSTSGDRSRLIKPVAMQPTQPAHPPHGHDNAPPKTDSPPPQEKPRTGGGDGGVGGVDTAIIGLLRKLPVQGVTWTAAEQKRFLTAFTHTIEFLYPVDEGIKL